MKLTIKRLPSHITFAQFLDQYHLELVVEEVLEKFGGKEEIHYQAYIAGVGICDVDEAGNMSGLRPIRPGSTPVPSRSVEACRDEIRGKTLYSSSLGYIPVPKVFREVDRDLLTVFEETYKKVTK